MGFFISLKALQDAEAVLLVDNDETEAVELDLLFDQRVGADDELRLAAIDEAAVRRLRSSSSEPVSRTMR